MQFHGDIFLFAKVRIRIRGSAASTQVGHNRRNRLVASSLFETWYTSSPDSQGYFLVGECRGLSSLTSNDSKH